MYKSISMYFLLVLGYFAISTIPWTEVSAQQTIAITAGDNQSTTRGNNFPNAVTFRVTDGGNPVNNKSVSCGTDDNTKVSLTATGPFAIQVNPTTNTNGEVTIFVKANADALYETCRAPAFILVGTGPDSEAAIFYGTITDVLNFSAASTTRSVDEGTATNTNIGTAVSATHWANADMDTSNDVTLEYSLEGTDASSFSIDSSTGQLKTNVALNRGTKDSYSVTVKVEDKVTVKVEDKDKVIVRSDDTIDVTISVTRLPAPTGLMADAGDGQVRLSWTPPSTTATITGYEYSSDNGANWATGGAGTTFVVMNLTNGDSYTFRVRAVSGSIRGIASASQTATPVLGAPPPPPPPPPPPSPVQPSEDTTSPVETTPETPPKRKIVIQECPLGWVRSDGFAGRTRRVLLYEVKLQMDIHNLTSIYKPDWVAIYVHPDEALETLDGWKLQVAPPYNHHRDYLLTAENSVVVDAGFVEGGFAFIENPIENPFPMTGIGFTGSPASGFDYRLYDETGKRVDFGISCYKRGDIFQVLKELEDPRVLRKVLLESFDWDAHYLRSEWTVPTPAPAAPSLVKKSVVGTWADLKKK